MEQEKNKVRLKYLVCVAVASLITVAVFWSKGFFTDDVAVNIQILADGFFVSGIMLSMFAGLLFISSEGALIGVGYVLRHAALTLIPFGRLKQESYKKFRERRMEKLKKYGDNCMLVVGLIFLFVGIVFNVIWYVKFFNPPAGW
jgi:uncharacterized membrane protein YqaE (UPF0057 family)